MAGSNFRVAKSPEAPKISIMHGSATRAASGEFAAGSTSVGDLLRAPFCFTSVNSTLVLDMQPFQSFWQVQLLSVSQLVALDPWCLASHPWVGVGMNINFAVFPATLPRVAVDNDGVRGPGNDRTRPSPGCECRSDRYAGTEPEHSGDFQAARRPGKDNDRVIIRHIYDARIGRQNLNVACI